MIATCIKKLLDKEMLSEQLKAILTDEDISCIIRNGSNLSDRSIPESGSALSGRSISDLDGNSIRWEGWGFPYVRGYLLLRWGVYLLLVLDFVAMPLFLCMAKT